MYNLDETRQGSDQPLGPDVTGREPGRTPIEETGPGSRERGWRSGNYLPADSRSKSPALATILSAMPGLGQVYIGYYEQGFINILVVASLINVLSRGRSKMTPLLGIFLAFYWLYNMVDAWRRATFYNQALTGLSPFELPESMKMPGGHGSLFGGALLILLGALAFAHTMFDYSLEWVGDWWPLALVFAGAYLIVRAVQERKKGTAA